MKIHQLHSEVWLTSPLEQVFAFFADPKNLQRITPDWLHFEILSPDAKIDMGSLLDYRLKLRGIPLHWQSEISVWQPPHRFVDHQTKGPYRLWVHEHTFQQERHGTRVSDHVRYAAAGGALVHKIFRYRQQVLEQLFAAEPCTSAS